MFSLLLKKIKVFMALISPVKDPCVTRLQDLTDKRPLRTFSVSQKYFSWDTTIDVKTDVRFCLLASTSVIGPGHGKNSVNEGTVNCHKLTKLRISLRQEISGLFL